MGAYQKLSVTVRRGGVTVDRADDRPLRVMPDDTSGVVFAGDVYPVHREAAGAYIELDDAFASKARCPLFVVVGDPIRYAADLATRLEGVGLDLDAWSIESNRYGHYVVFDGSYETAETVVGRLAAAGMRVRRWDVSTRPAADGYQYDWFARLDFDG